MNNKKNQTLTADDIRAIFAETDRRMAETAERIKELGERNAKAQAETDKQIKELGERIGGNAKAQAKTDKQIKKLGERIGGLSNNVGHHAEQFFQDSLARTLTFGGEKYDCMIPNLEYIGKENGEFDIVLLNGKSVAIIEAKNRIHPNHITELKDKKIAAFRRYFPRYNDCNVYLGLAGFSFCKKVIEEAKQYGIGIIKQVGESIEIDADKLTAY